MKIPEGIKCPECNGEYITYEVDEISNEITADCDDCDHRWEIDK